MGNDRCSGHTPTLVRAIDSSRTLFYDDHRMNTVIDATPVFEGERQPSWNA